MSPKKKLIISLAATFVLAAAAFTIHYFLSLHKVTFEFKSDVDKITVYRSKDKVVGHFSSGKQTKLQNGKYYFVPKGENFSKDKTFFTIKDKDLAVEVSPSYTKDYLKNKLSQEYAAIKAAVSKKYPKQIKDFTLDQGSLYQQGQWFGGLLKPKVSDIRQQKDPYRIVLHKEADKWKVVRRPEYVLTSSRYQEVPIEVLKKINLIIGEP